jgi:hypothetical protein
VDVDKEEPLTEEELPVASQVIMKFILGQYLKCLQIAPDDRFLTYLTTLEKSFDQTKAQSLIHMILTCVSMP